MLQGHVKRDPDTGAVAVRTIFDETLFARLAWLITDPAKGSRHAFSSEVDGWDDLYVPVEGS